MFDGLNRYGLPRKYAVIGFCGGVLAAVAWFVLGQTNDPINFVVTPLATALGGYVGGIIRERRGKQR